MNENSVTITGNLTRDPELRFTPSGQANASFGVAVNRRWQNRQTQAWEEATSFFDITTWGQLAENLAQSLRKGDRVMVAGRLDQRSWENHEGEKRSCCAPPHPKSATFTERNVSQVSDDLRRQLRCAVSAGGRRWD